MRRAVLSLVSAIVLVGMATGFTAVRSPASAQDASARVGRLGGTVAQFERVHGDADDASDARLEYSTFGEIEAGVTAEIHKGKIYLIEVDWDSDFELQPALVTGVVNLFAPTDAVCEEDAVSNGLGDEVTLCHSASLVKAYSTSTIQGLGFSGVRGDFNYALDFDRANLTISIGHDEYEEPEPTPVPPTPTPTLDQQLAEYALLPDVRELAIRPGGLIGQKFFFYGTILSIQVAPPGDLYLLGDDSPVPAQVAMQVTVVAPDGSTETVFVAYDGDTTGMFEGSYVVVYGEVVGTQSGINLLGGAITQPLVKAIYVSL